MSIYEKLYPFQKQIIDKFFWRPTFGLFLDMGLGKTPLACGFAEYNCCDRVIVVTINSKATETIDVKGSWPDWLSQSEQGYKIYNKWSNDFENVPSAFIINYESLFSRKKDAGKRTLKSNVVNYLRTCKDRRVALIIDESHKLKNLQSKQTSAVMYIKSLLKSYAHDTKTYLLTGTPFTTGYIDLYAQLKMLGYEETKSTFIDRFCERGHVPGLLGWQQPIVSYKNLDELYRVIHNYAITIKSEEVVNLPDKIFVEHTLPQSEHFTMFTTEHVKSTKLKSFATVNHIDSTEFETDKERRLPNPFFRNIAYPDLKWLAETSGTFWLRARQLSIGFQGNASESIWYDRRRLEQLRTFLEDNEDNYVLFYNFTPELLELYDICESLGYNIDVYCGEIKSLKFYNDYVNLPEERKLTNRKNVILANFASGSTGMNWQEYNKCIIFSTPLYKDFQQGIKRIHRLGQKSTVIYHTFSQDNWLDKGMQKSLNEAIDYDEKMFETDRKRIEELMEEKDND